MIVALIAVVVIGLLTAIGNRTSSALCQSSTGLGGGQGGCSISGFGVNSTGQFGTGNANPFYGPVVSTSIGQVKQVSTGYQHTIALKPDGTVWVSGAGNNGQLGNGTFNSSTTFVQANTPTGIIAVAGGAFHNLALRNDGTVYSWGYNPYGALGNTCVVFCASTNAPAPISGLSGVTAVVAGQWVSYFLKSDGTVWASGFGGYGELGNGGCTTSTVPVQVTISGVVAIAAGYEHAVALKSDGTVWGWGYNGEGELGDSSTTNRCSPVAMSITNVSSIGAGGYHSLIVKKDGSVWATGRNSSGELGDGTTTNRLTPVQSGTLTGITSVTGGTTSSVALKSDGTVWDWGGLSGNQTPTQLAPFNHAVAVVSWGNFDIIVNRGTTQTG